MSKKVLIRKQAGGVQQFQEIGGRRGPSFMGLARRLKDPTASGWQKVLALGGMAGKAAAGVGAANQTLQQLHGGNAFAPLNMAYTYQGLDPTSGMEREATLGERQDAIARNDVRQRSNQTLSNLHQQGYNVRDLASGRQTYNPPANLPAETPDSPSPSTTYSPAQLRGAPQSAQRAWSESGAGGIAPPKYIEQFRAKKEAAQQTAQQTAPPLVTGPNPPPLPRHPAPTQTSVVGGVQNVSGGIHPPPQIFPPLPHASPYAPAPVAPAAPAAPVSAAPAAFPVTEASSAFGSAVVNPTSVAPAAPVSAAPAAPVSAAPAAPVSAVPAAPAPNSVDLRQAQVTPLSANHRTPISGQKDETGGTIVGAQQTGVPDPWEDVNWQQSQQQSQQQIKSFATYVLDEFGDMLHKADPHVAGLLAFRVYMDKVMR